MIRYFAILLIPTIVGCGRGFSPAPCVLSTTTTGTLNSNIGVNAGGIGWVNVAQKMHGLSQLPNAYVRDVMQDASVSTEAACNWHNLESTGKRVLAIVMPMESDFDDVRDFNVLDGREVICGYGAPRYSKINVDKMKQRVSLFLDQMVAAGDSGAAFEIGNELDWMCFNADIPQTGYGDETQFVQSYERVLSSIAPVIKSHFPNATVLSWGMSNWPGWTVNGALQNPVHALKSLPSYAMVDGIAIHAYPAPTDVPVIFNNFAANGFDKELWITEWGFNQNQHQAATEFLQSVDAIPQITQLFYYSLDDFSLGYNLVDTNYSLLPFTSFFWRQ